MIDVQYSAGQPKSTNLLVPDLDFLGTNGCWNHSQAENVQNQPQWGFPHNISVGMIFWTKKILFLCPMWGQFVHELSVVTTYLCNDDFELCICSGLTNDLL
jgi:hypothetical protein